MTLDLKGMAATQVGNVGGVELEVGGFTLLVVVADGERDAAARAGGLELILEQVALMERDGLEAVEHFAGPRDGQRAVLDGDGGGDLDEGGVVEGGEGEVELAELIAEEAPAGGLEDGVAGVAVDLDADLFVLGFGRGDAVDGPLSAIEAETADVAHRIGAGELAGVAVGLLVLLAAFVLALGELGGGDGAQDWRSRGSGRAEEGQR